MSEYKPLPPIPRVYFGPFGCYVSDGTEAGERIADRVFAISMIGVAVMGLMAIGGVGMLLIVAMP